MHRSYYSRAAALAVALAGSLLIGLPAASAAATNPAASPTPTPTSAPGEVLSITERTRAEFVALQSGKIDRAHYAKVANDALPDADLAALSKQLKPFGAPKAVIYRGKKVISPGAVDYYYTLLCEHGNLAVTLGLDAADKIAGLSVGPE